MVEKELDNGLEWYCSKCGNRGPAPGELEGKTEPCVDCDGTARVVQREALTPRRERPDPSYSGFDLRDVEQAEALAREPFKRALEDLFFPRAPLPWVKELSLITGRTPKPAPLQYPTYNPRTVEMIVDDPGYVIRSFDYTEAELRAHAQQRLDLSIAHGQAKLAEVQHLERTQPSLRVEALEDPILDWLCATCGKREPVVHPRDGGAWRLGDREDCQHCGETAEVVQAPRERL